MNKPYNYTANVFSSLYTAAPGENIIPYIEISKARKEYWWASDGRSYTYGTPPFERSYQSSDVVIPEIDIIAKQLAGFSDLYGCFINYYNDQRNSLGWHSDDSSEIDHTKSLYVVSFGQSRVIQFMPIGGGEIESITLEHGSVLAMLPGCQQTHLHRIPKAGFVCKPRASFTFRALTPI